jgi:hypothetical protein
VRHHGEHDPRVRGAAPYFSFENEIESLNTLDSSIGRAPKVKSIVGR